MAEEVTLPAFFDAHVHLRRGDMLKRVLHATAQRCSHAVVMPNTHHQNPVQTADDVVAYRQEIEDALKSQKIKTPFMPLMTAYLTPETTYREVIDAAEVGTVAFKLYPKHATTASDRGIPWPWLRGEPPASLVTVCRAMADAGVALCIHAENPEAEWMERESSFVAAPFLAALLYKVPDLRVSLEHLSTVEGLEAVRALRRQGRDVVGTITLHHLVLTVGDVVGSPMNFCRPCPRLPADREQLRHAAFLSDGLFFLGSDSAPHAIRTKSQWDQRCAGCYTAPLLAEKLIEVFDILPGNLNSLRHFASEYGRKFYKAGPAAHELVLERKYGPVRYLDGPDDPAIWQAGGELDWCLRKVRS